MKFSKLSQLFLVSVIGLLVATLLTACQLVTIDYLFVASSTGTGSASTGQIQTYDVDSESGALRPGAATVKSGGVSPVSLAVTSDFASLYVANAGNSTTAPTVVHFTLNSSGILTSKDSVTPVSTPVAIAVSPSNTGLFIASGTTSGTLTSYSLSSGTIGSVGSQVALTIPGFAGDTVIPTGVDVLANSNAVYVTTYDQSAYNPGGSTTSSANPGWVFGFNVGTGGALTPITGSPWKAGVKPSAIASDPTNRFVYITDFASNQLIAYTIQSGSVLDFLINGPFATASEPTAVTIDPRGKFMYVSNALSNSVSAYVIDLATGTPSAAVNVTGASVNATDTQPVAILVDPALGRFVYTSNHLGDSVSGFRLDPTAGTLITTQATPYPSGAQPTALASVPHGNHSVQSVAP
jgi:6-phosphogluconolactonase